MKKRMTTFSIADEGGRRGSDETIVGFERIFARQLNSFSIRGDGKLRVLYL